MRARSLRFVIVVVTIAFALLSSSCGHSAKRAAGIDAQNPVPTLFTELKVRLGTQLSLTQLAAEAIDEQGLLTKIGEELTPAIQAALAKQGFATFFDAAAGERLRKLAEEASGAPPVLVTTWLHPSTASVSDLRGITGRTFLIDEPALVRAGQEGTTAKYFAVLAVDFVDEAMAEVIHNEHVLVRTTILDDKGQIAFEASAASETETVTGLPTRDFDTLSKRAHAAVAKLESMAAGAL